MALPRLYLAGPEVFLPDAAAVGAAKVALCVRHGFEGLFPLDAALDLSGLAKPAQARRISDANEGLMRSCAGLIANLTPFRGVSADSGTAFEVGFMRALGRPVFGYSNVLADYVERSQTFRAERLAQPDADAANVAIEDFDGAENLMIEQAIIASGGRIERAAAARGHEMRDLAGFEASLLQARRHFRL